ncbi:T9SS type A sorting domain-containing protein [Winogradskyella sp.]|uniref:T9SS type A sorting domain-containing protein n=1 Tax=Winogradskyella sp. TaxID=1883156 RepID=UPI003BA85E24
MKKFLLISFLIPFLSFGQVQIGQDIDAETADNEFGFSVSLSSDGNIVAIGATYNSGSASASGHVRVFENISGVWTQIGQDIDGEAENDLSGWSVKLSADGNIVAIGSSLNDGNGDSSGHVRVYENLSGVWTQIGQDIDGEAEGDQSGWSLSLSSDGSILAVGATRNDGNGERSGHVRVYENLSGVWTQIGQDIDGEAAFDWLGYSVSLSSNGSVLATGAIFNSGNGDSSGHVRVYENLSGVWTQIGQDIDGEAEGDFFGRSLSLSSNGNIVAIGGPQNDGNGDNSGHVRVYENVSGVWTQIGQDIDGEGEIDLSGYSVSLSSDGNIVAIAAPFNNGNGMDSGHVRIYENQSGVWTQIGQDIDGEAAGDLSGSAVSLSSDGSIVAIGANVNQGSGLFAGHVRVFNLSNVLTTADRANLEFDVYPNPTKDQFTIQLDNPSDLQSINIYNPLGQLVLSAKEVTVDISKFTSGLYTVEVLTTNGKDSKKLIIQ